MGLTESLEFVLSANPSSAISGFNSLASASDRSLSQVESNVAKIGKSMLKLGGAGMGVGGLLTQIASGDEQAAGQLKASIEAAGQVYSDFSERIDKAVQSQVRFGHTDEQTNQALATLVGSFDDTGKALDEMQLVTDLAARKNISLGEAATMVAKAHGGAGRVFKEFNIQVAANADGTKDYDGALTQLADKLKGQAAAGADTATGKFKALKAEVENIVSEFGQRFGPVLLVGSTAMTALGGATTAVAGVQARHAAAAATAAAAQEAENAALLEGVVANEAFMASASGAVTTLYAEEAAAGGLVAALGPVAIAVGAVAIAYKALSSSGEQVSVDVRRAASATDEQLLKTAEGVRRAFGGSEFQSFVDKLRDGGAEGVGALQRLRDATAATGGDTSAYDVALGQAKESQDNLNSSVNAGATAMGSAGTASSAMTDRLKSLGDQASALTDKINAVADAGHQLLDANLRAQAAPIDLADAQARAAGAKAKLGTGGTAQENAQFQRDYDRALIDVTRSANNLAQAQVDLQAQTDKANGITDDSNTQNSMLESALGNVASMLTGPYATAVQSEIDGLDAVNRAVALQIEQQDTLTRKKLEASGVVFSEAAPGSHSGFKITSNASGGPLGPRSLSEVNEMGLEMFSSGGRDFLLTGNRGGYVHTAQETAGAMRGDSGGFHVGGITIIAPATRDTPDELVRALRRVKVTLGRR